MVKNNSSYIVKGMRHGCVETNGYLEKSFGDPIPDPSMRFSLSHGLHLQYGVADALGIGGAEFRDAAHLKARPVTLHLSELLVVGSHGAEELEKLNGRLREEILWC